MARAREMRVDQIADFWVTNKVRPLQARSTTMHVTDLAINKMLGMQLAPEGNGHILEMPESPLLLNHVGTIHAGAQFALAEASSGEFLLRQFGDE